MIAFTKESHSYLDKTFFFLGVRVYKVLVVNLRSTVLSGMIFEALHLVDLVDEAQFTYVHPKDEVFKVFHTKFGCLQVGFEASIAVRVVQEVLERFGPEGRQNALSDFTLRVQLVI